MFDKNSSTSVSSCQNQPKEGREGEVKAEKGGKGRLLTPEEAAQRLRVSPVTIRNWCWSGRLPAVKVSVLWRIWEKDLDEFIKEQKKES